MNVAFTILVVLIVLAAILLIVVVLLQNGKDGGPTWWLIGFILVLAIASTLVISRGTGKSASEAVSSEILNQSAPASETPAFPVEIPQADPTQE